MNSNRAERRAQERKVGQRILSSSFRKPTRGFGITVTNNIVAVLLWNFSWVIWERQNA